MKILLKGGRVIDPSQNLDQIADVLISDGKIEAILPNISAEDARVIDCRGLIVCPGLIDMHVHLREPGEEWKETIETGTKAAVAGGFTAVACMPNTKPPNDNAEVTRFILKKAEEAGLARVYPVACITRGQKGESLTEFGELKEAGAVALSDDGYPVSDAGLMRLALEYAKNFDLPIISHSEELALSKGGHVNEGLASAKLGLKGIPAEGEAIAIFREAMLAKLTGTPIHIAHVSTKEGVEIIRRAKAEGIPVTAETAPHYFSLTEEATFGYQTNAKVNPPLRSEADREAIIKALADGTLDVIATDHAPHSPLEKLCEFEKAACGLIGLETALPLALRLVREKVISLSRLVELMSCNPAKILGVPGGSLKPGEVADVTVFDPEKRWVVDEKALHSKSKNTPFLGWEMQGQTVITIVSGKIVFSRL
ncbi:dihydroorotase, multifunctional complex type [Thermodesulfatator indicus DSM 15286]|uniref:Dihydroorotase n=1 Tax=Thermodesulfatator indicus (strain DSM 15286 / JCM 11887 / CIR29812) TaxID=667014 RepID=F8ADI9_THEID|nr:dihydroorotase [Thermodesulfatator indicus]AEH44863.1 dihydroorotase, multifunctional complex type [Thermodesulfatator indicus DSM 15286]